MLFLLLTLLHKLKCRVTPTLVRSNNGRNNNYNNHDSRYHLSTNNVPPLHMPSAIEPPIHTGLCYSPLWPTQLMMMMMTTQSTTKPCVGIVVASSSRSTHNHRRWPPPLSVTTSSSADVSVTDTPRDNTANHPTQALEQPRRHAQRTITHQLRGIHGRRKHGWQSMLY